MQRHPFSRLAATGTLAAALSALPALARADEPPPAPAPGASPAASAPRSWHVDVGLGTEFPAAIGLMTTAELPYRILLQINLGWMPKPYANTVNAFLRAIGTYDDTVSQLITNALGNSFVLRASAGWRPFTNHGFEVLGGYTLVALGGGLSGTDLVQAALAESGSTQTIPAGTGTEIPIHAVLHNFQITLGWRWLFAQDRLALRASVSYLQCVAAQTGVSLSSGRGRSNDALETKINEEIHGYLDPYFTTYVKSPVVGLSAAYRF